jgi:transketolase
MQSGGLPDGWDQSIPAFPPDEKGVAGRDASQKVLNAIAPKVPWLIGGAADLAPSTKTRMAEGGDFQAGSYEGRNFHFGIREHAMGAILNGMALSKVRPYGSGFLIFSDYMRAPIRLSSLMEIPVMYIFTHDSIGVGEDGPTHQPIEQLISLRAIPQLFVIRPGDGNEVAEAWRVMMSSTHHPIALILSRQPLPTVDRTKYAAAAGLRQGAYVLGDSDGAPEVIFMGTGSELQLCVAAHEQLKAEGIKSRVVSMPCWELFERQPEEYRESVLPASVRARVAVEAGTSLGWRRYTGIDGRIIARRDFGASAPLKELLKQFGFTVEKVIEAARESMAATKH